MGWLYDSNQFLPPGTSAPASQPASFGEDLSNSTQGQQTSPSTGFNAQTAQTNSQAGFGSKPPNFGGTGTNYNEISLGNLPKPGSITGFNPPPPPPVFPGANTGVPTPPGSPAPAGPNAQSGADNINAFYDSLMQQQEGDWQKQQGILQNQMGGFQREADSLNARMGGSIAGGYAGLAGSGLNRGMQEFNKASLAYNQLRQATGRDKFGALQRESERQEEHTWDLERQDKDTQMRLAELALQYPDVPPEQLQAILSGEGDVSDLVTAMDQAKEKKETDRVATHKGAKKASGKGYELLAKNLNMSDEAILKMLNSDGAKAARKKKKTQEKMLNMFGLTGNYYKKDKGSFWNMYEDK